MRSNSARVIVCLVALVESSTMKVDPVLRESTLALTATLPNSVTTAFGIFSASSRRRSAAGFHSTGAAFTSCATCSSSSARLSHAPCPGCLPQRTVMCTVYCEIWRVYPGVGGSIAGGRALPPRAPARMGRQARQDTPGEGRKATFGRRGKGYIWRAGGDDAGAFLSFWFRPLV